MKERPILFSGAMVHAILQGHKTQTRRVVKSKHSPFTDWQHWQPALGMERGFYFINENGHHHIKCPYGQTGDRLWVRETWAASEHWDSDAGRTVRVLSYKATSKNPSFKGWKPSIHMRRADSRITLEITGVRVERLQDIREEDARAEGVTIRSETQYDGIAKDYFFALWESVHGLHSWAKNPWVWVISFKRVEP